MKTEFIEIKNAVLETIRASAEEVLPTTKIKKSGIYMIYVDCFDDEKVIPIYIGQSNDIQKRYKSHYQEILALNRLSYEEYKKYTQSGLYDGAFKSCKIFRYMVEHNCSLSDYHIIPLEYCDESALYEREQFYINVFKSEYFGFNQLNATSLYMEYAKAHDKNGVALRYFNAVKTNALLLKKYWGFGFTVFNYEYAFYKSPLSHIDVECEDVRLALSEANAAILTLSQSAQSEYVTILRDIAQEEREIDSQINSFDKILEPIDAKIDKHKRLIRKKFVDLLNYSPTRGEFEHFIQGMHNDNERKLFNAAMKKQNIRCLAYVRLKKELAELDSLYEERGNILSDVKRRKSEPYEALNQLHRKRMELKAELRLAYLLPHVEFQPFALKDCKRIEAAEENSVLFVASNNGRNSTPEIIAVYSNIGGVAKTYYVQNQTTTQAVDYIERYAYFRSNSFSGKREVYKIIPRNSDTDWEGLICDNHISVLSEYKTGINEFTFVGVELTDIVCVIKELIPLLNANPKAKLNCTESSVLYKMLVASLDKRTYKKLVEYSTDEYST